MIEKDDIIAKMNREIEDFALSYKAKDRDDRLSRYRRLLDALCDMPLTKAQIETMNTCKSLLQIADSAYTSRILRNKNKTDYTALCMEFTDEVYRTERANLLYERVSKANDEYHDMLCSQQPQNIIREAYQITIKDDIVELLTEPSLSARQIDTLLTFPNPLNALYYDWLETNYSHMDELLESVEATAEEQAEYLQRWDYVTLGETPSPDISVWNAMYGNDMCSYDEAEENETDEDDGAYHKRSSVSRSADNRRRV